MIKQHSFRRVLKFGFVSFWRHWWLSLTSILIMAITLIIICLFVVLTFAIQASTNSMKNKIDMNIALKPEATAEQIKTLQLDLSSRPDVRSVEYVDKSTALTRWNNLKIKDSIKNLVNEENNPLPEALAVKVDSPENLDAIDAYVNNNVYQKIVETTSYKKNRDAIQTFLSVSKVIKQVGWTVSIIFFSIALLIILNTIRMAIFTRKDEIEIMKLVGASDHFISIPFIVEGVLYGLLGCLVSLIFMSIGVFWLSNVVSNQLAMDINIRDSFRDNFLSIVFLELLVGILIGVGSSIISVKRHLRF
jgi:cell division transport system permease protein